MRSPTVPKDRRLFRATEELAYYMRHHHLESAFRLALEHWLENGDTRSLRLVKTPEDAA